MALGPTPPRPRLRPWSMVVGLGTVSLLADVVSDGAMSIGGALLGQLGATALLVGLVAGGADALALAFRVVTGPWADRTGAHWTFTIVGYAMSVVSVPLLALAPQLGSAALVVASVLLLTERAGKAVRAPSKTVLLAGAARSVGSGRGFGVHKVLDQIGAFAGPLVVAGVAAATGALWPAFLVLAVPGAAALVVLFWLRSRVPDPFAFTRDMDTAPPAAEEPPERPDAAPGTRIAALSGLSALPREVRRAFLTFGAFATLTEFGLFSFGVIAFHLTAAHVVPIAAVPLVYAVAMAAAAVGASATGWLYDRRGAAVLYAVPLLTALVPSLALAPALAPVIVGVLLWGGASGIQDSTVKALVADLVPSAQLGAAFGWLAVFQGIGALAGAVTAGAMYGEVGAFALVVLVAQLASLVLLIAVLRRGPGRLPR